MKMTSFFFVFCLLVSLNSFTQSLINGGLEGPAGLSAAPNGWQIIPFSDPYCEAQTTPSATPDILTLQGPDMINGLNGNPHGGLSFSSGLFMGDPGDYWHEGIQQTVSGFIIHEEYRISFWQTVIKQLNALDTTGSWKVYLDNQLIAMVPVSHSLLPLNSSNHVWDYREVNFIATNTVHTLKFLPADDDLNQTSTETDHGAGVRMGIDDVQLVVRPTSGINEFSEGQLRISPSPTFGAFVVSAKNGVLINSITVSNYLGAVVAYKEAGSTQAEVNFEGGPGIYFVTVTCEDGKTYTSRIQKI